MFTKKMLNEAQRKAVEDTEGAVVVFAGAGSGKTRVLTHRIIYLIEDKGVNPWNILAITFTNRATREMKRRLDDSLGENSVWVSTFHSLCAKMLFRYAERLGYGAHFSIFDESASNRAFKRVLREKHLEDDKRGDYFKDCVGIAKNRGQNPEAYRETIKDDKDADLIMELYERYDEVLKENDAMDFDDLLIKALELLTEVPEARECFQDRFRYILVDEFQDTNEVQCKIIKLLSGKWGNVFVVGDDDQSIYGWRGADVENILNFDKLFDNARVYKLEENYRSTPEILECANNIIKNNLARSPKTLFTNKPGGVRVEYLVNSDEYEETDRIISAIYGLKKYSGYLNGDIAILVRNNSLTRIFETNFNRLGMKYKVYGGFKFFERKEILDVVAYLRLIVNPKDSDAFLRIVNFPKRKIGDATVEVLDTYCREKGISLWEGLNRLSDIDELPPGAKAKLKNFEALVNELTLESGKRDVRNFVEYLIEKVGFKDYYLSTERAEDENRWANIAELLNVVREGDREETLNDFLQNLILAGKGEEDSDESAVTISTMHSAKGLEFKVVFLAACEEGIIPSSKSLAQKELEEERRVMYVAATRAKERLYISYALSRRAYKEIKRPIPSRFVAEARGENLKYKQNRFFEDGGYGRYSRENHDFVGAAAKLPTPVVERPKVVYRKDASGFAPGKKVRHKKYGTGTVIIVTGEGRSAVATVAFKGLGLKKFALMNAPLELL